MGRQFFFLTRSNVQTNLARFGLISTTGIDWNLPKPIMLVSISSWTQNKPNPKPDLHMREGKLYII